MSENKNKSMTLKECADALIAWMKCEMTLVDDCPTPDCAECPYDVSRERVRNATMYAAGVLGALATPARLYTAEEIAALSEGADIWIEEAPIHGYPSDVYATTVTEYDDDADVLACVGAIAMDITDYNLDTARGWRAWNKRPPQELCNTTKWNGGKSNAGENQ